MKKNGSLLVIMMWILALLVLFALGLGQRTALNLRIAKNQRDRLISASIARSGAQYAMAILDNDLLDAQTANFDSLESCGVNLKNRTAQEVFTPAPKSLVGGFTKTWDEKKMSFKIGGSILSNAFNYGPTDEERRININGYAGIDKNMLIAELLKLKNIEEADELAAFVGDWVVKNTQLCVPEELQGVFEYYYVLKNTTPQEARSKARSVYLNIKDEITLFGAKLNMNTVSLDALRAISRVIASANGKNAQKADALAGDLLNTRNQGVLTGTDSLNNAYLGADDEEKEIFAILKNYLCVASNFFRIESLADVAGTKRSVIVIYDRTLKSIVYRREI